MYSLSQVRKAFVEPTRLGWELNRLYHRRFRRRPYNADGVDLFETDWDNLLVLDACRYDTFESRSELPGTLGSRISRGSATKEWIEANFDGRTLDDTVYVTANPVLYRNRDAVDVQFHDVVNVWKEEGWNETYRTVFPETVTDAARRAAERYPKKRLLVHYLQPHFPFLGPTGRDRFDLDRLNFRWRDVGTGALDVDIDAVRRAYVENLDVVLPHVETLLEELRGKTVVTADHGQMLGERGFPIPLRGYGHPPGIYNDALTRVPWLISASGPRKEVVGEAPVTERDDVDESVVADRLEQLGYAT
jgi:hypothetical protein